MFTSGKIGKGDADAEEFKLLGKSGGSPSDLRKPTATIKKATGNGLSLNQILIL